MPMISAGQKKLFLFFLMVSTWIVLGSCNGNGKGRDDGDGQEDVSPEDGGGDVQPDPQEEDVPPDPGQEELHEDPAGDELPGDPQADEAQEVQEDMPEDPAGEEVEYPGCTSAGGACTSARWELCPRGQEPIDTDPHRDCPMEGWCCVDAPPSTCSDDSDYNCVVGARCEDMSGDWGDCWGTPDGTFECEEGRVCCMDVCW